MENSRKITVKDVALKCDVSVSLAAAVLSNSKNNIGCSVAKREKILKAAQDLNYRSNQLARAMKTGIVPLVALCIHHTVPDDELNLYLHDLLPSVTSAFKHKAFNTIFIPFDTVEDLIAQTQFLVGSNLISGIITNFPPEHGNRVADYLKQINLPYIILGGIADETVPCVVRDSKMLINKLAEYAVAHGFKRVIKMLAVKNLKNEVLWEPPAVLFSTDPHDNNNEFEKMLQDKNSLLVAFGEFTRRLLVQQGVNPKNIISVENKRVLVQSKPTIFVKNDVMTMAGLAAEMLTEWIMHGNIPTPQKQILRQSPEDIEIIE